jgi:hypothetical protein
MLERSQMRLLITSSACVGLWEIRQNSEYLAVRATNENSISEEAKSRLNSANS